MLMLTLRGFPQVDWPNNISKGKATQGKLRREGGGKGTKKKKKEGNLQD